MTTDIPPIDPWRVLPAETLAKFEPLPHVRERQQRGESQAPANHGVPRVPCVPAPGDGAENREKSWDTSRDTEDTGSCPSVPDLPEPQIERPCFAVHDDWFQLHGERMRPGLYWHGYGRPTQEDAAPPVDHWICTPIHATAITRDEHGHSFGLLLRFRDPDGRWRSWAAPLHMLRGSGEELRGELLDQGVRIDPTRRGLLAQWLMGRYPDDRVLAAGRTGWHDHDGRRVFVLPDRTLGGNRVMFQVEHAPHDDYQTAGTLDGWRREVAGRAEANSLAVLSISAAFAGPLLRLAKLREVGGAGLHLLGDSSQGKSSLLAAAASAWGPPGFVRTWRATANGLEGVAHALNDTLLVLDEIGEALPREVGQIVYAVSNGTGKQRARRTGGHRPTMRWRVVMLSSGEKTLAGHMAEAGQRAKAGQEARLLNVPISGHPHGVFDTLHGHAGGRELADGIRQAAAEHHGHAGPAFIEALIGETRDLPELYRQTLDLPAFAAETGIEGRAAGVFALVALAGELAIEHGIVPWPAGAALDAAGSAYEAWRHYRGAGHTEDSDILDGVRDFIARHGDARFSALSQADDGPMIRDRAGYWSSALDGGRVWYFHATALREAAPGYDLRRVLDALDAAGWIAERDGAARSIRLRVAGTRRRVYAVSPTEGET